MSVGQGTLEVAAESSNAEAASLLAAMPPRIQVHDDQFRMLAKGFGALSGKFDPGLYLVRVELGKEPFERVVRVQSDGTARLSYPISSMALSSSAAVVQGTSSLHEYTGDFTRHLSRTTADLILGTGARLVVLASRQNSNDQAPIKFSTVRLLDRSGNCIADLARRPAGKGPSNPTLATAFAAELNPGGLVLEWKGERAASYWRQPLWIPEGYVMLVFVTVPQGSTVPDMASASIHLADLSEGFDPREGSGPGAEVALESLRTGRQLLSEDRLADLLRAKFHNPMLGIYGGHMVLQRSLPDAEKIRVLAEVLSNLDSLIPGSPDVAALRLMSSKLQGASPIQQPPCSWPPLIRSGYVAFRSADWDSPGAFIESGSLADRIRTELGIGGVWSKWVAERNSRAEFPGSNSSDLMKLIMGRLSHSAKALKYGAADEADHSGRAITRAGRVVRKQLLSQSAPAVPGESAVGARVDLSDALAGIRFMFQHPAEVDASIGESLAWTGLNKRQIQDVAKLLL